ncbi:hypothetical protein [Sinorhizobium fredii]|uniref:hypothetical protein n=1 Tax=Rhizobium fredii TaxID=380 RepID=UPI0011811F5F|nr:hypothetical protein [Sinorhizobium fredii]
MTSARFPFLTQSAVLNDGAARRVLVDGGYADNTGALTASNLISALRNTQRVSWGKDGCGTLNIVFEAKFMSEADWSGCRLPLFLAHVAFAADPTVDVKPAADPTIADPFLTLLGARVGEARRALIALEERQRNPALDVTVHVDNGFYAHRIAHGSAAWLASFAEPNRGAFERHRAGPPLQSRYPGGRDALGRSRTHNDRFVQTRNNRFARARESGPPRSDPPPYRLQHARSDASVRCRISRLDRRDQLKAAATERDGQIQRPLPRQYPTDMGAQRSFVDRGWKVFFGSHRKSQPISTSGSNGVEGSRSSRALRNGLLRGCSRSGLKDGVTGGPGPAGLKAWWTSLTMMVSRMSLSN